MWPSKPKLTPVDAQIAAIKLAELEDRVHGLEQAVIQLCKAISQHNDITDNNFRVLSANFMNLVEYVVQPRDSILGDQRDKN